MTAPRAKILDILARSGKRHMSADEVYRELQGDDAEIGQATVYRVLTHFVEAGLVSRQSFDGGHWVFELNRGEHHYHLICDRCGRIVEFADGLIAGRQSDIARKHGFDIRNHSLVAYGLCRNCQRSLARDAAPFDVRPDPTPEPGARRMAIRAPRATVDTPGDRPFLDPGIKTSAR